MVAARRTEGQSDLWALPANGGPWQRLTATTGDERWPAWHPNGHTLAYAARRDRNWDIYSLELRTGQERRLTTDPHFEGWPAWSPDGRFLAFASFREGDLDLFLLDINSNEVRNLTAESPAHDFEPSWEDANHLLFVSTRDDSHDIFRLSLADDTASPLLTSEQRSERQAMVVPGRQGILVVAAEGRTRDLAWLDAATSHRPALSWAGGVTHAALSPDGGSVAWLEHRWDGEVLYRRSLEGGETRRLNGPIPQVSDLAWGMVERDALRAQLQPLQADALPPYTPQPSEFVRLSDVETTAPRLSEQALPAFQTMRARVAGELGEDFLGTVSELVRPIHFSSEESDYLSWHKAGRAVDTLLDLGWRRGIHLMDVVREDWHGDVYWRYWIRCPQQDGSCGEPLVEAPWDLTLHARRERAPGQGGLRGPFIAGYYIDFTHIAEDEGWERISSYEIPEFDWRENMVALEYWHYQYTDGLNWYEAMSELYSPDELNEMFGWAELRERDIPLWRLRSKGIPLPADVRTVPAEMVIP